MGTEKAGRIVMGVGVGALDGKMNLVLAESFVDGIDGLHEPFLARAVFGLLRRKQIQLHATVALQLREDDTCLFVLVMRQIDALQKRMNGLEDEACVVGRSGQFESVFDVVLREVRSVTVGCQKDRYGAA